MSVLVLGALHWDTVVRAPRLPALDETLPGSGVDYRFGGKGGNQAVAAARAGADVAMWGRVGDDAPGAAMLAALDAAGVERSGVAVVPGPSGMSVAISVDGGEYGAVIVTGANARNDGSGVLPDGTRDDPPVERGARGGPTAALARAKGTARVILNAAPSRPVAPTLAAAVDLWVVNRVEAASMGDLPRSGRRDPGRAGLRPARRGHRARLPRDPGRGRGPPVPATSSAARWPRASTRATRCPPRSRPPSAPPRPMSAAGRMARRSAWGCRGVHRVVHGGVHAWHPPSAVSSAYNGLTSPHPPPWPLMM